MDIQAAIDVLKRSYPKTCKMVGGRLEGGFDDLEGELGQALTLAIDVLDSKVPKKPVIPCKQDFDGIGCNCPTCGSLISCGIVKDKYCCECGQKIDWSEMNNLNSNNR